MVLFFLLLSLLQINSEEKIFAQAKPIFDLSSFKVDDVKIKPFVLNDAGLSADAVLIQELNGRILFEKNINKQREIASLTKLMSAFLGFNLFKQEDLFIFDSESVGQEGTVGNFFIGERVSRDDILKASLISSSNDAIYLLAKTYGLENFVNLMNKKAQEWQMFSTKFVDPTGLGKNISTARDIMILLTKIYSQSPEIFSFSRLETTVINKKNLWTTNILLPKYSSIIIGGKTGYKETARENLVLILKFESSPFLGVVILGSENRWKDAENIIASLKNYYAK
jgi:D-alanyl-D-alanine carboxypeptidase